MAGVSQAKGLLEGGVDAPPEDGVVVYLRMADRALGKVEEYALTLVLLAMVVIGAWQVIKPEGWMRETIKYGVLFIGMVAGALATQSDRLFNIDMVGRLLAPRGRLVVRIITALFTIGMCWVLYKASMAFRDSIADEAGEPIKPALGMLPLPYGALLIATHLALHALIDVYYLATGKPSPDVVDLVPKA